MFAENPKVNAELRGIVRRTTTDVQLHEELFQQGHLHLLRKRALQPGQTLSWYLDSCACHLLNYLGQGRSIDSLKHRSNRYIHDPSEDSGDGPVHVAPDADVVSLVSAKEILDQLLARLEPLDQRVLVLLDDGFSTRGIALEIGISQSKVVRASKRIRVAAEVLGILPYWRSG